VAQAGTSGSGNAVSGGIRTGGNDIKMLGQDRGTNSGITLNEGAGCGVLGAWNGTTGHPAGGGPVVTS